MRFEYPVNEAAFATGGRVHLADGPNSECKDPLTRIYSPQGMYSAIMYTMLTSRTYTGPNAADLGAHVFYERCSNN